MRISAIIVPINFRQVHTSVLSPVQQLRANYSGAKKFMVKTEQKVKRNIISPTTEFVNN